MPKTTGRTLLLSLLFALIAVPVAAQEAAWAVLSPPNTEAFPQISALLKVFDGDGNFVHGLTPQNVQIVEDESPIPIETISEIHTGAQFVVAINMGPAFAILDAEGFNRYERVEQSLTHWIDSYPSNPADDLSLLTNDGLDGLHFNRPVAWLSKFNSYAPNYDGALPSLDLLARAITTASDPVAQPNSGRGILFVTSIPSQDSLAALPSLASLAAQNNVRVYIWMVSSRAYFNSVGATQLADFAAQTGGTLFAFSGEETLPNVDPYVDALRYTYSLTYESQLASGDTHQARARITTPDIDIASQLVEFILSVQPPNPIFIAPPIEIQRNEQANENALPGQNPVFAPIAQELEILIEFPDGFPRSLKQTTLYVDGEIVAENTAPPYEKFTWDLSEYTRSSARLIQVEAVDQLGLRGATIEHNVQILVQEAPFNILHGVRQNAFLAIGIVATLALSVFVLLLIIGGRIQPRTTGRLIFRKRRQPTEEIVEKTPLETPVSPPQETPIKERKSTWMTRLPWYKRQEAVPPQAYIEISRSQNGNLKTRRIPITQREITFGSDPRQATIPLDDASVEGLHARLVQDEDGIFHIADEDSIAGTWVNHTLTTIDGGALKHGDIIHIGRVRLQFKLNDPHQIPKPKITPQESL